MLIVWTVAITLQAVSLPQVSAPIPSVGDVFVNETELGQQVRSGERPNFDEEGNFIFKGWRQGTAAFWGADRFSFEEMKRKMGCCFSIFERGRDLLLTITKPISTRSDGEVNAQRITETRLVTLRRGEAYTTACYNNRIFYNLVVIKPGSKTAHFLRYDGASIQEGRTVLREDEVEVYTGSNCSDEMAWNYAK